jgi:hypothetical protein
MCTDGTGQFAKEETLYLGLWSPRQGEGGQNIQLISYEGESGARTNVAGLAKIQSRK